MAKSPLLKSVFILILFSLPLFPCPQDKTLTDNASVLTSGAWDNNATLIKSKNGFIIVDTLASPQMAAAALKSAGNFAPESVIFIINTHHHWDHSFGNSLFSTANLIASPNFYNSWVRSYGDHQKQLNASVRHLPAYEREKNKYQNAPEKLASIKKNIVWLKEVNSHLASPLIQKQPEKMICQVSTLHLDQVKTVLFPFHGLHSDSDILVLFPDEGVLCTGDIFSPAIFPYVENARDLPLWLAAIKQLLERRSSVNYIVPGHGPLMKPDELFMQLDYIRQIAEHINYCLDKEFSLEETYSRFDLSPFQKMGKHEFLHKNNFEMLYYFLKSTKTS